MGYNKLLGLAFQNINRRKFHGTAERSSNWRSVIKKDLESGSLEESDSVCIYRIPPNIRQAEPKAYEPNIISIGPYHYGSPLLQDMEKQKKKFFRRLFDPNSVNGAKLEDAFKALEELQGKARACYDDKVKLSSDEFLQMMLIDGSFIVQLLKDFSEKESEQVPDLSKWMLSIVHRDLIMLENQLPMIVLSKLFELTDNSPAPPAQPSTSLNALALPFLHRSRNNPAWQKVDEFGGELHLLDLYRSSIVPKLEGEEARGIQSQMIHTATELKEAGVKIKANENRQLLDIRFGKKWGIFMRELTIPPLHINDHRGTVFRNVVAFEKYHKGCNPDVTTYLFFLNRLINSSDDVALLRYKSVLRHSLQSDKSLVELIDNIVKEIVPNSSDQSYLHKLVNDANKYFCTKYAGARKSVVNHFVTR